MTTEKCDLTADLAICAAATAHVPETSSLTFEWDGDEFKVITDMGIELAADISDERFAHFIAEARTGWPHAIERAIAAEREVDRLQEVNGILVDDFVKLEIDCANYDRRQDEIATMVYEIKDDHECSLSTLDIIDKYFAVGDEMEDWLD